jgi:hypothetical protein
MADEQTPQNPPASDPAPAPVAPSTVQQAPAPAVAVPLTFLEKLSQPVTTLWQESRVFLLVFGIIILIVKFRDVIIDLILGEAKHQVDTATKTDAQLKSQENAANDQANQLRKEADTLSDNLPPVTDDWNKK